jgi:hypothetical protein
MFRDGFTATWYFILCGGQRLEMLSPLPLLVMITPNCRMGSTPEYVLNSIRMSIWDSKFTGSQVNDRYE